MLQNWTLTISHSSQSQMNDILGSRYWPQQFSMCAKWKQFSVAKNSITTILSTKTTFIGIFADILRYSLTTECWVLSVAFIDVTVYYIAIALLPIKFEFRVSFHVVNFIKKICRAATNDIVLWTEVRKYIYFRPFHRSSRLMCNFIYNEME